MRRFLPILILLLSMPLQAADRFTGMASCASSGCHGGGTGSNQCQIWRRGDPSTGKRDPHHSAADILGAARSKEIGKTLKIDDPAKSASCTVCHSPMSQVPEKRLTPALRSETKKVDRGVSCEACHGPAESWLRYHTRPDLTHQQRVAAGLRELGTPYTRVNACVGCHTNIDPALVQAAHPELKFEFARQLNYLPKHWEEKKPATPGALWLTGQAAVLREWSWSLSKHNDPILLERWRALFWVLKRIPAGARALPSLDNPTSAFLNETREAADRLARSAAREDVSPSQIIGLAAELGAGEPSEIRRRAEHITSALQGLAADNKALLEKIAPLRDQLKPGTPFSAPTFADSLRAVGN